MAEKILQQCEGQLTEERKPGRLENPKYRYDAFQNGEVLWEKKKHRLPAMGWNSWNAFGSGNTEALTKAMADALVELGLDKLGYRYVVLDDGCYQQERVEGKLANEPVKFPGGFKALGDYIHQKGLKFGMYNDIGTNLCAGAAVGTYGHEEVDTRTYVEWGVDFLKVDNCYFLFDDATFSDRTNARYVYAPNLKSMGLAGHGFERIYGAATEGILRGFGVKTEEDYVTGIGTKEGTGPENSPVGESGGELVFLVNVPKSGTYDLFVEYATGMVPGVGSWLQIAVGEGEESVLVYDDFLKPTESTADFRRSELFSVQLQEGENVIRLMNHRRQENTLSAYAALLEGFEKAAPGNDIILSICEWGKTQPQNWGYKVGDSWRILNDITFRVGADGENGHGSWVEDYTTSVTSQYNKAVIMDEFAGLDKGWNDPDMMMIGMDGMTDTMSKTHMTMWSMMNCPLMLGLDLRRVRKGDALYQIIANEDILALNQDRLGIPAKRVYCSLAKEAPDKEYIRDTQREDILAKPLADGSLALSFFNLREKEETGEIRIDLDTILEKVSHKMINAEEFQKAEGFVITDLWSKEQWVQEGRGFSVSRIAPCDNVTWKIRIAK